MNLDLNNLTIKFCDNNIVKLVFETKKGNRIKYIKFDTFCECVIASKCKSEGVEDKIINSTPILPCNSGIHVVQYIETSKGITKVILKKDKCNMDIILNNKTYKNVGIPTLLFGIIILHNKIISCYVRAIKNIHIIDEDSVLYLYPFSNVSTNQGSICFGLNDIRKTKYDSIVKLKNIPNIFLSMPNNYDMYTGNNLSSLKYEELLNNLQNKEFDDKILIKTNQTYKEWVNNMN